MRNVFKDCYGEVSFKKVLDVNDLAAKLAEAGIAFDAAIAESLGAMLLCFGDIEVDRHWADRDPPDNEEQRKARMLLTISQENRQKIIDERKKKEAAGKTYTEFEKEEQDKVIAEEDEKIVEHMKILKAKVPIKVKVNETSIHDLLIALDRSAEYDRMMCQLGVSSFENWFNEDKVLKKHGKPYVE